MKIRKNYFESFSVKDFNGDLKNYMQYLIIGMEDGWYAPSKIEEAAYPWLKEVLGELDDRK